MTQPLNNILKNLKTLAALPLNQATALPKEVYTSKEFLALEQQKIFQSQWLCAGRTDQIKETGSYLTYAIDNQPIVIIRQADNTIAAFANVCLHRMMTLLNGAGRCKRIVCPYHAWTYDIKGQLVKAPHMQDRPGFDEKEIQLPKIRVEIWQGWIYVTLNPTVEPISKLLADLEPIVAPYAMEHYIQIDSQEHIWNTNWKQLTENFMEGYHLPVAHKATVGAYFPVEDTCFADHPNPAFTYQTFTKTKNAPVGTAHKDNKTLKGKQRQTSILPTIFPTHMITLAPDHLWYLSLQPQGVSQVKINYGVALAPEVLAASKDPDKLIKDTCDFLNKVNQEDKAVVEGIHQGAQAPLSTSGPLCWLERENHEFAQYLSKQLFS